MIFTALICLLIVIYFDSRLLKKHNEEDYHVVFVISKKFLLSLVLIVLAIFIFAGERADALSIFIVVFLLPFYLIKRYRFLNTQKDMGEDFQIASDAFGVVLVWFFGGVIISTIMHVFLEVILEFESELSELMLTAVGSSILLLMLVYKASQKFSERGFLYNVGLRRSEASIFKIAILPAILGIISAGIAATIVLARDTVPETPLGEIISQTQSSSLLFAFLILAVCFAPLFEEIVFRGYLFHVLERLRGLKFTIVVISLSFAFLHVGQYWGDWLAILVVTALGFLLTIFRAWTKSTIASVTMHYFYNGGVIIIPVIAMIFANPAFFKYQAYYSYLGAKEKEALLIESIQKEPDLAEAYNELAWLYVKEEKNLLQALVLIDKALDFDSDFHIYLDTKAAILEKLGRYEEALVIRKELLERE